VSGCHTLDPLSREEDSVKLLKLLEQLEHERARLEATGLEQDAEIELAVEGRSTGGYVAHVAPLRQVSIVGASIRLTARPS
jgi:hypothetical protein